MSQDISLYLLKNNIPSGKQWNKALRDQGFKLRLGAGFDPIASSGFVPCGDDGFEYYSDAVTPDALENLAVPASECDWVITLCAQGDAAFAAAFAVLSSVAQISGGKIDNMQSGEVMSPDVALSRAREQALKSKPKPRTPNHLSNAIKTILLPTLAEHGFRKLKNYQYYRVRGRLVQSIYFVKYRNDETRFRATSWYTYLLPHQTSFSLSGKLDLGNSGLFVPFGTAEQAELSMNAILKDFIEIALPKFELTATPQDYLNVLNERPISDDNYYQLSDLGCSMIDVGDNERGLPVILKARLAYQKEINNNNSYFINCAKKMDDLIAAVENGTQRDLLEAWFQASLESLKLSA